MAPHLLRRTNGLLVHNCPEVGEGSNGQNAANHTYHAGNDGLLVHYADCPNTRNGHTDESAGDDLPIPGAKRLEAREQATAARLMCPRSKLFDSEDVGTEFVDDLDRSDDAVGHPSPSEHWDERSFLRSIDRHVKKSNDFTVVDVTGFSASQRAAVARHVGLLPDKPDHRVIIVGR